jgi:hypothetical protein
MGGRVETKRRMETKSHHKTESALNECLLFEIEINKSTSINVITQKNEAKTLRKTKKKRVEVTYGRKIIYFNHFVILKIKNTSESALEILKQTKIFHTRH